MLKKLVTILAISVMSIYAADLQLPKPALNSATLKSAMESRRSTRQFTNKPLDATTLSNLFWVSYGANRENGKRTIAAALGKYAISMYLMTADGIYRHNRDNNTLTKLSNNDLRKYAEGRGTLGPAAGAVFLLVADYDTFKSRKRPSDDAGQLYIGYEAGSICQNIYLYCAVNSLNALCCGSLNADKIAAELKLPANQKPILTMIVGYNK